ncbi:NAD(P)/FAD-dependent oxidoreductase [Pontibacter virosus]|uniref:Glycine/D-amino acid oxidase-like deaminating enzyme n=1 Tax=Pontibacter virosus TaxID=1765052 RepID=A0A2U1ALD1_9BACT|nr:FAD-binding oxidoreductase [Pontibacter virosus]PVY37222.1 glycine/D-amino acid oxidase-like deaminating enzyme [Pontibacter virosus]
MNYDYIVVGHGIAGATLAYTLRKQGQQVLVIDEPKNNSASRVAAGLVNPVAGKRFAKSWLVDTLLPYADSFYDELEDRYKQQLFVHKPIYKVFSTIEEQNNWMAKSAEGNWSEYIGATYTQSTDQDPSIQDEYGGIMIRKGGYLRIAETLDLLLQDLQQANALLPERFEINQLQLTEEGIAYKNITARHLVFCEGWQAVQNPYFSWLPLQPTKGEVLEVQTQDFNPECIYNKAVYVVPVGEGHFKIGATYNWRQPDELPTPEGREELSERFEQITTQTYQVSRHWAGIRPAVRDRRPLMGRHPKHAQLSVFNGMGSKGVLMAPYLADVFAKALIGGGEILPDVHISRYYSLYYDYIKHHNQEL